MATRPLELVVKMAILEAVVEHGYSIPSAAKALQISPMTVYRKLKKWRIEPPYGEGHPGDGGSVLMKDFRRRAEVILRVLHELKMISEDYRSR